MSLLAPLALLPLLFWLAVLLDPGRRFPRELFLPVGRAEVPAARVSAVVPARDEAATLPETLPALLAQQIGAPFSVVVVDDASADGTAETARRLAAEAGAADRLTVLEAPPAPPGWSGKVHALAHGVAAISEKDPPDWLLLTDADIRHRPGSVAALMAVAHGGAGDEPRRDLVSVMARLHAEGFWEKLLVPPFVCFFQLLYPFRRVARAASPVAAAAGGCVLVRRAALEAAGGLEAIRGAVIDDVSLARKVAETGGSLWLGFDPGIVSVRRYRGLGGLWRMVSRTAFTQLGESRLLLAATLAALALFVASPPFLAAWALAAGEPVAAALALAGWGAEAAVLLPYVRHHRLAAPWSLGLPFASILFGAMTATSAWDHLRGRGARWKGRTLGK